MRLRSGVIGSAILLVCLATSCNSDRPEPAEVVLAPEGVLVRVTRVATHPFLSRYNLTLRVEQPGGCVATTELFPDTGYAGRRNVFRHASGAVTIVGQYDVRLVEPTTCTIRLIEFRAWDREGEFVGSFDVDAQKRWQFIPATARRELPFEKL